MQRAHTHKARTGRPVRPRLWRLWRSRDDATATAITRGALGKPHRLTTHHACFHRRRSPLSTGRARDRPCSQSPVPGGDVLKEPKRDAHDPGHVKGRGEVGVARAPIGHGRGVTPNTLAMPLPLTIMASLLPFALGYGSPQSMRSARRHPGSTSAHAHRSQSDPLPRGSSRHAINASSPLRRAARGRRA